MKKPNATEERPSELLGVKLSPTEKALVRALASASGVTASRIARLAVQEFLALRNSDRPAEESL